MPKPIIRRKAPKKTAQPQNTIPITGYDLSPGYLGSKATMLNIKPTIENGILIQFKAPKHGMKPINMPKSDKMPRIKLAIRMADDVK